MKHSLTCTSRGSLEYALEELVEDYKVAKINGLLFAMKVSN